MNAEADTSTFDAAERIRALGARATPARLAVLRLLKAADRALSHHDIEQTLASNDFDRVTLYRVLDWLVESGLAHRVTDSHRVFRFSIAAPSTPLHNHHAHFRCDGCGRVFCLADVAIANPALPKGFSGRSVEFCVTGQCDQCDEPQKSSRENN